MPAEMKRLTVHLHVLDENLLGGFHQELCSLEFPNGTKAVVTSGLGLGNADIYVSVEGKRVLAVDARPMLNALIDEAARRSRRKRAMRGGR